MIRSYLPAVRRQLLSKHLLISTMPERVLDDLVKFFDSGPRRATWGDRQKMRSWRLPLRYLIGPVRIYSTSPEGSEFC
jgi:hypothetical protein